MRTNLGNGQFLDTAGTIWMLVAVFYTLITAALFLAFLINWDVSRDSRDGKRCAFLAVTAWAWPIWILVGAYRASKDALSYVRSGRK